MKKIEKKISKLLIVMSVLLGVSCEKDILEIEPQDRIVENAVWGDANLIRAYHTELYNAMPHGFVINMMAKYTDEMYNSTPCCGADLFKLNTYGPDNIAQAGGGNITDFWATENGYMYNWDHAYIYIRKINLFLEKMEETGVDLPDKDLLIAEAKFIRAFVYFDLIERFGGVPIVDEVYDLGEEVVFERNTFEEVVAFIEQDLGEAKAVLPDKYESTDPDYGRPTNDAAQALLSRLYLYAASPLFNSGNDQQKWQKAADAAEDLINNGDYSLYPDYQELFQLSQGDPQNEVIFSRGFTSTIGHSTPMNYLSRRFGGYGGWWGSGGPTGNLMNDYEMLNGELPFLENGQINPASGYDPQSPFEDRDPRFNASIIHDESIFRDMQFEMWISEDGTEWGYDSYKESGDNPRTNTVLKKFMPKEGTLNWQTPSTVQWIHFRLAEIYLNYAEAKFELGDEATAREYLNKVRSRPSVDMPDIPATVSGEELRQRIYNERRIELAFEGHRFFDVRRWEIADEVEEAPITTIDIYKDMSTGDKSYVEVILLDRSGTFQEHQSLLPIAQDEIQRIPELTQTPGY